MRTVLLIGGSPMTGKSTAAAYISLKTEYACISTDDIGAIVQNITGIDPWDGQNYLDYYTSTARARLVEDLCAYHTALTNPINALVQMHLDKTTPLIIEGYALYPKDISEFPADQVARVWLVADKNVLKKRLLQNKAFFKNAADKRAFAENFLYRSLWHNKAIYEQCQFFNQPFVMVGEDDDYEAINNQVAEILLAG